MNRLKLNKLMRDVFVGWQWPFTEDNTIEVFNEPTVRTPKVDPFYSVPELQALEVMAILDKPERNNVWLSGWTGVGKSSLIRQLAGLVNAQLFEMNGHEHMTPANAFGRWTVRAGETIFQYGVVVKWLREGGWLLINEYSTLDPSVVNALKSCLEFPRTLMLTEHNDDVIVGHPDCRIIVADNTEGRGDDSGAFINTNVQSIADLRRFNAFVKLDYLSADQEIAQLKRRFPDVKLNVIEAIISVANQTRDGFKKRSLGRVLSTAEVVNWCENYQLFTSAHASARISFLNAYEPEAATAVRELINAKFGHEDNETLLDVEAAKRAADKTGV